MYSGTRAWKRLLQSIMHDSVFTRYVFKDFLSNKVSYCLFLLNIKCSYTNKHQTVYQNRDFASINKNVPESSY